LKRRGCQVECIDLVGTEEDVIEYNKLVRDKIPKIIESRGERVEVVQLTGDALLTALRQKLVEEAYEALDAKSWDELVGELSDIEEIIRAIGKALQLKKGHVEAERKDKEKRRGGFASGVMLKKTTSPHSLPKRLAHSEMDFGRPVEGSLTAVISKVDDLPTIPTYRRPDQRRVDEQAEKLLTFETEMNKLGELKETVKFTMPMNDEILGNFNLAVEIRRNRSTLRGVVRLRSESKARISNTSELQLKIQFPETK
jgi:predicted house-cleaning noncanonical NTP pyrophosphatase (MazG superfamily)